MLRFLLRRIPRFGFLTLFAAMLLFVSGAGWFKFHLDLYLEEERLFADLAKAGCQVTVTRQSEPQWVWSKPGEWLLAYVPMFDRCVDLRIHYPTPAERPLAERGASLPFLHGFGIEPISPTWPTTPIATERNFDRFPSFVPETRDVELPSLSEPLPDGESLTEPESSEILAAWRQAWSKPEATAPYGVVLLHCLDLSGKPFWTTLEAHVPNHALASSEGRVVLENRGRRIAIDTDADGRRLSYQLFDKQLAEHRIESQWRDYHRRWTGRAALQDALDEVVRNVELSEGGSWREQSDRLLLGPATNVRRTEHGLIRVDLPPIGIDYPRDGLRDEIELTALLNPERKFAVEAFDLTVARSDPKKDEPPAESVYSFRGAASDHGEFYVLDACSCRFPDNQNLGQFGFAPVLVNSDYAFRFAYDLENEPPAEVFRAATYGIVPFSPPSLPFWRWYRATLAISFALLAFVAVRRLALRFGRPRTGPLHAASTAEGERTRR